jgi:Uma2 family endonuclease
VDVGASPGGLVRRRTWHAWVVGELWHSLKSQAPAGVIVEREMAITLDERNRLEPDLVATTAPLDLSRTFHAPGDVLWVAEVVSPESAYRDRTVKPRKYAEAGIAHYWRVEDESAGTAVHVYELDEPTRSYAPTGVHRRYLRTARPFELAFDLDKGLSQAADGCPLPDSYT